MNKFSLGKHPSIFVKFEQVKGLKVEVRISHLYSFFKGLIFIPNQTR